MLLKLNFCLFVTFCGLVLASNDGINNHTESDNDLDFSSSLPESSEDELNFSKISKHVKLKLYTIEEPDNPYILNSVTIDRAPMNPNVSTTVVIPGWFSSADQIWLLQLKDKYFIDGEHNIIIVGWEKYARNEYIYAARKAKLVGKFIGQLLVFLYNANKLQFDKLHVVGHGLGAHSAGFVGKQITKQLKILIKRITGLDPERKLFEFPLLARARNRLDRTDANFVDVIHTSAGDIGMKTAIGHADFYPNGGRTTQPGCFLIGGSMCSHRRAYQFYIESVNSENFLSTKCDSWKKYRKGKCGNSRRVPMGLHSSDKVFGKFYLRTNKKRPYAKG